MSVHDVGHPFAESSLPSICLAASNQNSFADASGAIACRTLNTRRVDRRWVHAFQIAEPIPRNKLPYV
jgi:hypothetical protein